MIGLVDIDSKIPNLALMRLSSFFKAAGEEVELLSLPSCRTKWANMKDIRIIASKASERYEKLFASVIFDRSQYIIDIFRAECGDKIEFGGIGSYEPTKRLAPEIEAMAPDYDLYTVEEIAHRMTGIGTAEHKFEKAKILCTASHGYSSRGCPRSCPFCKVPKAEGKFCQAEPISKILSNKSNILVLHDNNLTADPDCILKLNEIRDRKLICDINQGIDVRLVTPEKAKALSEVIHLRSLHYAWDLIPYEKQVMQGIDILKQYIPTYKHMCYVLVGFNTTYEQDWERCKKLIELGVDPYVMVYNENLQQDMRLKHFARWINSRIYKKCTFTEYEPWIKEQGKVYKQMMLYDVG